MNVVNSENLPEDHFVLVREAFQNIDKGILLKGSCNLFLANKKKILFR
jgi:hypothetical protein